MAAVAHVRSAVLVVAAGVAVLQVSPVGVAVRVPVQPVVVQGATVLGLVAVPRQVPVLAVRRPQMPPVMQVGAVAVGVPMFPGQLVQVAQVLQVAATRVVLDVPYPGALHVVVLGVVRPRVVVGVLPCATARPVDVSASAAASAAAVVLGPDPA